MTDTRQKLNEAEYFLRMTQTQFRQQSLNFEFQLNAYINSARNVTFVMQKEYARAEGFKEWWDNHQARSDESMKKFVTLRNVSVKQRSIGHKLFNIKHDFGPDGLHVVGLKGPTSVVSDPIRFDEPIPEHSFVAVDDDNGHKRVKVKIVYDFSVEELYENDTKVVKFENFMAEATTYQARLVALVEECESHFSVA